MSNPFFTRKREWFIFIALGLLYSLITWPIRASKRLYAKLFGGDNPCKKNTFMLLLLCCLLWLPSIGMAAEITDQELTRLKQIFQQLEINNNALQTELTASRQDLTQARQLLDASQIELVALRTELTRLRTESAAAKTELETAQDSLQRANASLQTFEREIKRERSRLKFERNILLIGVGYLLTK